MSNGGGYQQNIFNLVQDKWELAGDYSAEAWARAQELIGALINALDFDLEFSDLEYPFEPLPVNYNMPEPPDPPTLDWSGLPPIPELLLDDVSIDLVTIPDLDIYIPEISFPEAPDATFPTDPGEAPTLAETEVPAKPGFDLPDVPTIQEFQIPSPPDISLPDWEGTMPVDDLVPPTTTFVYNEQVYQSELRDAINTKLLDLIENGGTGLGADVEDAIWTRARARKDLLNERVYTEALSFWAARGYSEPPGALTAALREALLEQTRADAQINYEIAIEQARLAYQATQHAIASALQHEGQLMTLANQVAQRAFEAARYTQEAAIAVFNAQVGRYNAKLQTYQVAAAVYESKIRAATLQLDQFKTRLEVAQISTQLQALYVDIYGKQINAVEALLSMYRVEMEGANLRAQMEREKILAYRAKIDAYVSRVNAITSQFNAYESRVRAEGAKIGAFAEKVRAQMARVELVRAQADINLKNAQIQIDANAQKVEEYKSNIGRYEADIRRLVAIADAETRLFNGQTSLFESKVRARNADVDGQIRAYEVQMRQIQANVQLDLEEARLNLQSALQANAMNIEALKSGALVAAQLASSALSSVAAGANIGYRGGYDYSINRRWSEDHQHTYRHD